MTWIRRIFFVCAFLAVVAAGVFVWMQSSLPVIDGRLTAAGLQAPVEILRTRHGVPQIYAQSRTDAYFALGFSHAQDRLWQMDFNRRIARGRLSEVMGSFTVNIDRFIRTLGFSAEAEKTWQALNDGDKALLQAYADGVNHHLATRDGALPPEFILTGTAPEPWQPQDSIVWYKVMALDLALNFSRELRRYRLFRDLNAEQISQLYLLQGGALLPALPELADVGLPPPRPDGDIETASVMPLPAGGLLDNGEDVDRQAASNSWVLSGSRTATGAPILANDPHLGLSAPSIWYLAHMHWPDHDTVGVTFPGGPVVVLGRSRHLAWGFTNAGSDVQDLYLEKLADGDPGKYVTPDGPAAFTSRQETIKVRFSDDLIIDIRATRHGPVISDHHAGAQAVTPDGYAMALAWTALTGPDLSITAGLHVPDITSVDDYRELFSAFVGPQQNMMVADKEGNIAHLIPALVPKRKKSNPLQGYLPSPGWDARFDWDGLWTPQELPAWTNPDSGQLTSANNRLTALDAEPTLGFDFASGYRKERIDEVLAGPEPVTLDSTQALQQDVMSIRARSRLPLLLAQVPPPAREPAKTIYGMLQRWNADMHRDRPEPLVFNMWMNRLHEAVYADEIGGNIQKQTRAQSRFMDKIIRGEWDHWCDDVTTLDTTEICRTLVRRSFDEAVATLVAAHGDDPYTWRWGQRHQTENAHQPFSDFPLLNSIFDIRVPSSGSVYTVNVGGHDISGDDANFNNTHAPAFRAIYDLANLDRSRFMISTGQSGNPFSRYYDDLAEPWAAGEYFTLPTARAAAEKNAVGRLILTPTAQ